jgi:hypothetical protein
MSVIQVVKEYENRIRQPLIMTGTVTTINEHTGHANVRIGRGGSVPASSLKHLNLEVNEIVLMVRQSSNDNWIIIGSFHPLKDKVIL